MTVTFVNLFDVPKGRDEAFLSQWDEVNTYLRVKPGYVEHKLHRAVLPDARYRFANVAIWASTEDWKNAHDDGFRALVTHPDWKEFPSLPTLYEVVHEGTA